MKKNNIFLILLLILSAFPLLDLFHPGLPITHDGQDHVARIANFYQNLQEGILIPRWAPNLNWGYGHPILMFLYPLPSYATSLIHFLGFSFVDSVKIFFGLAFVLSGLAMNLWLREFLSKEGAFVGAMLYMFAPYRFVDLYVRGAIGEHAAFIFPPLVLYFLFKLCKLNVIPSAAEESQATKLLKRYSGWRSLHSFLGRDDMKGYWHLLGGSLSLAGLILAHNAISLMFLPIIILYAVFLIWQSKKRKLLIVNCSLLIVVGFALSAFFWMPAFMEGKYTLRDIVTEGSVNDRFSSPIQLLYGQWSYGGTGMLSVQVGIVQWFFIFLSIPLLIILWIPRLNRGLKRNKSRIFLATLLGLFFFALFLMTPYSQLIWEKISMLQKFQFPWRFLSLSVFLSAVIGAVVVDRSSSLKVLKSSSLSLTVFVLLLAAILFANKDYWHANGYLYKSESYFTGIYDSTTDTGESAPIWSVRFMEKRPKARIEVIAGKAKIIEGERTSTKHIYIVDVEENATLKENTLYFPGWKILVDGKSVPIEFQNRKYHGIMTFAVDKGRHDVVIKFGETKLRLLADWISGISFLTLIAWGFMRLISHQVLKSSSHKVKK